MQCRTTPSLSLAACSPFPLFVLHDDEQAIQGGIKKGRTCKSTHFSYKSKHPGEERETPEKCH